MRITMLYILYWLMQVLRIYSYVLLAQAIMSWFIAPSNKLYMIVRKITDPFINLFRPLSNRLTSGRGIPIDLAFLFAVIALQMLAGLMQSLFTAISTYSAIG